MSVLGARGLTVVNTTFSRTGYGGLGTPPMAGVDIEPDRWQQLSDVQFLNCTAEANTGAGFSVNLLSATLQGLGGQHARLGIVFEDCVVRGSGGARTHASLPHFPRR